MRHKNYIFPGFPILQDDEYFKMSQDSVLLADFIKPKRGEKLLDLGCGVGVIMMIAMIKHPNLSAQGLEINPGAASLARENLSLCGLDKRGTVITGDMRELPPEMRGAFDICACNPPYFDLSQGPSSPREAMAAARSQGTADIKDVCKAASRALKYGGRFYICYPPDGMAALFRAMGDNRLEPKAFRLVFPKEERPPCLLLMEARKGGGAGLKVLPSLIISRGGEKTEEFKKIYTLEDKG